MDNQYWNQRYEAGNTPWDAGAITPPLRAYIDQLTDSQAHILLPGAGNGHEAVYLYQKGFRNLYLCDWAARPLAELATRLPDLPPENLICCDFFELELKVDLILEQTFFCALPRSRRQEYAQKTAALLQPNAKLAGVLFASEFEQQGPPFGGTATEYRELFAPFFDLLHLEPCYNSIQPRSGNELFVLMRKKA